MPHPHPQAPTQDAPQTFNQRAAGLFATVLGSMVTFWIICIVLTGWMIAQQVFHGFDQYPYALALFAGNLIQLLGMLVIQVTQNIQSARQQQMLVHLENLAEKIERQEARELSKLNS